MLTRQLRLAVLFVVTRLPPSPGGAAGIVYDSPDGSRSGPTKIPLGGGTHVLNLWFDASEQFTGYSLPLSAELGFDLKSFTPAPGIFEAHLLVGANRGRLYFGDSYTQVARHGPILLGQLLVEGLVVGATLELGWGPTSLPPIFLTESFGKGWIRTPQLIAVVVPEPSASLLIGMAILGLAGLRHSINAHRCR